jgi:23S rRNA pseudouridine2457 synthase
VPEAAALAALAAGPTIQGERARPCEARLLDAPPNLPPRDPPVRFRKSVADAWLELTLTEGRNRQVRRMTAAVGHPTLRLVRCRIGRLALGELERGAWRVLSEADRRAALEGSRP